MRLSKALLDRYAQQVSNAMIDPSGKVYGIGDDTIHEHWAKLHKSAFGIFVEQNRSALAAFLQAGWLRFAYPDSIQGTVTPSNVETVKNFVRRVARMNRGNIRTFYVEFTKTDYVTIPISPTGVVDFTELDNRVGNAS